MEEEMRNEMTGRPIARRGILRRYITIAWLTLQYLFDKLMDFGEKDFAIIKQEGELFFGTALTLIGVFSFQNGKNCDGNTADYLSCTRPSTFYYYGAFEILLIVVGVFFIMLWFLRSRHAHGRHE